MTAPRDGCPSPIELERAFWHDDPQVRAHTERCIVCERELGEMAALKAIGAGIAPAPLTHSRREELRSSLVDLAAPPARPARWRSWVQVPLAVAATLAVVWWLQEEPMEGARRRASVLDHGGAGYLVASAQPDEVLRLVNGSLSVEVAPLGPTERFRVVTGDAELEASDAAFDVTAKGDRLVAVRVMHGTVELRASSERRSMTSGQIWELAIPPVEEKPRPSSEVGPVEPPPLPLPTTTVVGSSAPRRRGTAPEPVSSFEERADALLPTPRDPTASDEPTPVEPPPDAGPPPAIRSAAQQAFDDGWSALRAKQFDAAAAAFERATTPPIDPFVTEDAVYWRAVSLGRAGRRWDAVGAFERFLTAYPRSVHVGSASVMLGWMLFESGQVSAAETRFRAAAGDPSPKVRTSAAEGLKAVGRASR